MKKVFFFAALAACLFTACQKEMNAPAGTTLTASILETRTAIQDNVKVIWSAGDQINVNGQTSKALTAAGATASFQFDAALTAPFKAVYPASGLKGSSTLTLPAELAASDGTFADGAAPMLAIEDSGTDLHFFHVVAYVRVPVKSAAAIQSVTFSGNAGEQVCGDFEIEWNSGQLMATDATEANQSVKVLVGKSAATVVIPVPATDFERGYKLTAIDVNGKEMTYVKPSYVFFSAGQVNTLPEVVFEPVPDSEGSGTEADPYLIRTASDLQGMAAKANFDATTYFKLVDNIDMTGITEYTPVNVNFGTDKQGIVIDGNHKVISNWNWVNTSSKYPGLVGVLDGVIKDLVFADCNIETQYSSPIGLACGWCGVSNATLHGRLENVHAIRCSVVTSVDGSNHMGGLVGSAHGTEIINCSFDGRVERTVCTKTSYIGTGGLVGGYPSADATGEVNILENCSTSGSVIDISRSCGGVVGFQKADCILNIKNCHSTADITSSQDVIGGIVGYYGGGAITDCWYCGNIVSQKTGSSFVGGIVPHNNWGMEVYRCHTMGTITCPGDIVGGITGQCNAVVNDNSGPCIIKECWSTMTLNGKGVVGGIIGRSSVNWPMTVENCWFSGIIHATGNPVGGIVGDAPKNSTVKDCWTDADITGNFGLGGIAGKMCARLDSKTQYLDLDAASTMTGCIYWGSNIKTMTAGGERSSTHWSSGAVVGCSCFTNTLKGNYRKPGITLEVYRYAPLNELFDHADTDPSNPLVQPYKYGDTPVVLSEEEGDTEDFKWFSPYHGKVAAADATVSSLAKSANWDEAVWDLSGDYPMLKNNPVPVSNK